MGKWTSKRSFPTLMILWFHDYFKVQSHIFYYHPNVFFVCLFVLSVMGVPDISLCYADSDGEKKKKHVYA